MRKIYMVGALIFLVGCSPIHLPRIARYTLDGLKTTVSPSRYQSNMTLAVSNPVASPGFETANMVYMSSPYELAFFSRNKWVAPPAQMLLPIEVAALRSQGYYKAVIPAPSLVDANFILDLQLLKLEQEFLLPESQVHMAVQATLLNKNNQVIGSERFSRVIQTGMQTPYGGVLAANQAVTSITNSIARWCVLKNLSSTK